MIVSVFEYVTAYHASGLHPPLAASLVAEGLAMRDAVVADLQPLVDRVEVITDFSHFAAIVAGSDCCIIIAPEFDALLERFTSIAIEAGGRLLGSSLDAVRLTSDKYLLAQHWRRLGIRTPETWLYGFEPDGREMVIKPRDGAGSQATRLKSLPQQEHWEGELIACEYIPGQAASASWLIRPSGQRLPLLQGEQHLSKDGYFRYLGGQIRHPWEMAERLIEASRLAIDCVPGLSGFVGVDLVIDSEGIPWVIEINPRFTTSYIGLRKMTNDNLLAWLLHQIDDIRWNDGVIEFKV